MVVVSGGEHVDVIIGAAVADGKVTPKVQSLIKILLKYQKTEDFRAIIFVERVVTALVLPKVTVHRIHINSGLVCSFFILLLICFMHVGFCRASIIEFRQICNFDWAQQQSRNANQPNARYNCPIPRWPGMLDCYVIPSNALAYLIDLLCEFYLGDCFSCH